MTQIIAYAYLLFAAILTGAMVLDLLKNGKLTIKARQQQPAPPLTVIVFLMMVASMWWAGWALLHPPMCS